MDMVAAAASPRFRRLGAPDEEEEDEEEEDPENDESEDVAGSGEGRLSPAEAAAISELMRSGKLRSAREPRMR